MGVPRQQVSRNRQTIINTASRAFRERGVEAAGVADLMKEAGFTHGGFYNHFPSKDALAAETVESTFRWAVGEHRKLVEATANGQPEALQAGLNAYLSPEGRDNPGDECPTGTLAVDAARQGGAVQAAYAKGFEDVLRVMALHFDPDPQDEPAAEKSRDDAIALLITLVGGITLARALGQANPTLSERVLAVARKRLPGRDQPPKSPLKKG